MIFAMCLTHIDPPIELVISDLSTMKILEGMYQLKAKVTKKFRK